MRFHKKGDWSNAERCEFRGKGPLVTRTDGTFGTGKNGPQCVREAGHKNPHIAWTERGQAEVLSQWYPITVGQGDVGVVIYGGGGGGGGTEAELQTVHLPGRMGSVVEQDLSPVERVSVHRQRSAERPPSSPTAYKEVME